jgi:hypothetical protein
MGSEERAGEAFTATTGGASLASCSFPQLATLMVSQAELSTEHASSSLVSSICALSKRSNV